jgi:hypothetical protein
MGVRRRSHAQSRHPLHDKYHAQAVLTVGGTTQPSPLQLDATGSPRPSPTDMNPQQSVRMVQGGGGALRSRTQLRGAPGGEHRTRQHERQRRAARRRPAHRQSWWSLSPRKHNKLIAKVRFPSESAVHTREGAQWASHGAAGLLRRGAVQTEPQRACGASTHARTRTRTHTLLT